MNQPERVLLIGMMGAGKTTTGRLLADRLHWTYLDSDDEIERQTGRTVPQIWEADGEPAFRAEETRVLREACTSQQPVVVSVAGGAVLDPQNREVIARAGLVVWLRADVDTLARRVGSGAGRPLLKRGPAEALARLSKERAPLYAELANVEFDVDRMSPPQVVQSIIDVMEGKEAE